MECNISQNNHITQDVRPSNFCVIPYVALWQRRLETPGLGRYSVLDSLAIFHFHFYEDRLIAVFRITFFIQPTTENPSSSEEATSSVRTAATHTASDTVTSDLSTPASAWDVQVSVKDIVGAIFQSPNQETATKKVISAATPKGGRAISSEFDKPAQSDISHLSTPSSPTTTAATTPANDLGSATHLTTPKTFATTVAATSNLGRNSFLASSPYPLFVSKKPNLPQSDALYMMSNRW